jgi:hypothetical protein
VEHQEQVVLQGHQVLVVLMEQVVLQGLQVLVELQVLQELLVQVV